jgi:hypothetical protein
MSYTSILLQLLPILLPLVMPWITALLQKYIPAPFLPGVNALLGAGISYFTGGSPVAGAVISHVVRSGLAHEKSPAEQPAAKK